MTTTLLRWEQDGAGGDHGKATYFPDTGLEATVTIATFKEAHLLQTCIDMAIKDARWDARSALLAQIRRIEP